MSQFWILQAFLPSMIDSNHGHVVCISSMCGVAGVKDMVPYCTSKFAVSGLMDSLGEEMRAYATGVKVTTVYPFYVDTGMARDPAFRCACVTLLGTLLVRLYSGLYNVTIPL
uniref:Uncharacterized protein n=1 Tax=Timema poppense TaxID=170557 RepID=A0A7R9HIB1_TIMPO|nr:unnamed protein product [Timema poppensis]